MSHARQSVALKNQIVRFDVFQQIPSHLNVRASDVQRTIRNDWESYVGNPDHK